MGTSTRARLCSALFLLLVVVLSFHSLPLVLCDLSAPYISGFGTSSTGSLLLTEFVDPYEQWQPERDAYATPNTARIWIPSFAGNTGYTRQVDSVVEVAFTGGMDYMLRYSNGSVEWIVSTGIGTSGTTQTWLSGQYTGLTSGNSHYCLLAVTGVTNCVTASNTLPSQIPPPSAYFTAASGKFKQISAAAGRTCGLFVNGTMLCGGIGFNSVPLTDLFRSSTVFSSIAAFSTPSILAIGIRASDGAIVKVVINGAGITSESVVWAAPAANESPFRYPIPCHEPTSYYFCGLRMNGSVSCNSDSYPVPEAWIATSTPMSQFIFTATGGLAVVSREHSLMSFEDPSSTGFNPSYWGRYDIFQPMKLWVIDPMLGNDTLCQPLDFSIASTALIAQTLANPCKTIAMALSNIAQLNTWIYLRPGNYYEGNLQISYSNVTIIDRLPRAPPGVFYPAAYQNNTQPNLNPDLSETLTVNLYCQNMDYCFQKGFLVDAFWIEGIQFHDVNLFVVLQDSLRLMLRRVHLIGTQGGLLRMTGGAVRINWVRVESVRPIPTAANYDPAWGLIQLEDSVHTQISDSSFAHNRMEGDYEARGSVITITSFLSYYDHPISSITRCSFVNNTRVNYFPIALPQVPERFPRCLSGVVINLNGTTSLLRIAQSSFVDNRAEGLGSCGLAVNVAHQVWDNLNGVTLEIQSCSFIRNEAIVPINSYSAGMRGVVNVQCGVDMFGEVDPLPEGTYVTINDTLFDSNSVPFGTATFFGVHELNVQYSTFKNNSYFASYGGTLVTRAVAGTYAITEPYPVQLISNTFIGNLAPQADLETRMNVLVSNNTFFTNQLLPGSTCQGGGLSVVGMLAPADVTVTGCTFSNLHCQVAGALFMSDLKLALSNSTFMDNRADFSGGAAFFRTMQVTATQTMFLRNAVKPPPPSEFQSTSKTSFYEGGAIVFISGNLHMDFCTFDANQVLPRGDDISLCQALYDYGTSSTYDFRAGGLSIREALVQILYSSFSNSVACSAADIYSFGQNVAVDGSTFTNSLAWTSAVAFISNTETGTFVHSTFLNTTAIYSAGALAFSGLNSVLLQGNEFNNCSSQKGDGAAVWIGNVVPLITTYLQMNILRNCSAPLGGGLLTFFSATTGGSTRDVTPTMTYIDNEIMSENDLPNVQYGSVYASDPFLISLSIDSLTLYAGQSFEDGPNPFNISVHAIDGFNQTVRGDRGLVVIVEAVSNNPSPSSFQPVLYGTVLRSMGGSDGGVVFTDLKIGADPGMYFLRFSVVGVRSIQPVSLPVTILTGCVGGTYFDSVKHLCTKCVNSILVYDQATNLCSPCPATRVPRDSSSCAICDLGKTNNGGSTCKSCPSNTYSPVPGAACQSCQQTGQEGLDCSQGDLAQVSVGWFAYSVLDDSGQPTIQTVQCPENFCGGGLVQQSWNDTATEFINGTSMTMPPVFKSAVTRFDQQCTYPRLATEDNYLCGQCADGLLPWGDKCSKCEHANGGLVFLLLLLTFLLVGFLLRGSLSSAQAGHSAIVLYFIQTAMLEVGSTSHFVSWLNIALLSPSSFSDCIAPATPYQQSQLQILMPLFLWAELLVICVVHFALYSFRNNSGVSRSRIIIHPSASLPEQWKNRSLNFIDNFSMDVYVSASFSILLFSYTQVTVACFSYLACVSVGDKVSVVFTSPTMVCNSSEYRAHLVLVVIAMVIYVAGFPLAIGVFLYSRQSIIKQAHELIAAQAQRENMPMELEEIGDISVPASPAAGAVVPSVLSKPSNAAAVTFLRRYSPLFSMYSPGAFLWILLVLARRVVFVSISVSLVRKPAMKFLGYSLAHLTSLLLQLWARPFQVEFYNLAEVVSHLLLILLSQSLTAVLPPYTNANQIYLFCLIIPPVPAYALLTFSYRLRQRRAQHAELFSKYRASDASEPANLQRSPMHELQNSQGLHDETSSAAIEMGSVAEPSVNGVQSADRVLPVETVPSDSASNIAAQHDSETL